ncbi:hypothetical protein DL95DRAFT_475431 [Leptodontidium sp. 2 PMI_412]|nr:hypothetical protein DL95DRAFT_475431 [Leptodontidium sp. 2 PMI_412]
MSTSPTPKTFPLFPSLPTELRFLIFSHALPPIPPLTLLITQIHGFWATSPSLPEYNCSTPHTSNSHFTYTDGKERYISRCLGPRRGVPALLHVNSEAREVALERYTLIELDECDGKKEVFFYLEKDMLVVRCHTWWGSPSSSHASTSSQALPGDDRTLRGNLARVANLTVLGFRHRQYCFSAISLAPFLRLKKLVLVRKHDGRSGERIERVTNRAVEVFWREKINTRQRDAGVAVTDPPEIEFLSIGGLSSFEILSEG